MAKWLLGSFDEWNTISWQSERYASLKMVPPNFFGLLPGGRKHVLSVFDSDHFEFCQWFFCAALRGMSLVKNKSVAEQTINPSQQPQNLDLIIKHPVAFATQKMVSFIMNYYQI